MFSTELIRAMWACQDAIDEARAMGPVLPHSETCLICAAPLRREDHITVLLPNGRRAVGCPAYDLPYDMAIDTRAWKLFVQP